MLTHNHKIGFGKQDYKYDAISTKGKSQKVIFKKCNIVHYYMWLSFEDSYLQALYPYFTVQLYQSADLSGLIAKANKFYNQFL